MERRVLVAIFLCFLVLYAWQALFVKPVPKPTAVTSPTADAGAVTPAQAATPVPPPAEPIIPLPDVTTQVADSAERDVRIETSDVIAVFTNRGGRLKSWRLKIYQDRNREPLELVTTELAGTHPLPFSLHTADKPTTDRLNGALYAVRQNDSQVAFDYQDSSGLKASKEFKLDPAGYMVNVRVGVTRNGEALAPGVEWGPGLGDQDSQAGRYAVKPGALFSADGKVTRVAAGKIVAQPSYEDNFDYAGVDDHYFMTTAYKPGRAKVTYQPVSVPPAPGTKDVARDLMSYTSTPSRPSIRTSPRRSTSAGSACWRCRCSAR
jgi:YidC/Oxa1 family membrane protein insertase